MGALVIYVARNLLFVLAPLALLGLGCVDTTSGDMALIEVRRVQAEAQANGQRLMAIESRQMYLAQQMSLLSGALDTIAKDAAARAEQEAKANDANEARIERLEKVEITRRERERMEAPSRVVERAQDLIDAGHVKVTTKNGRTRLELPADQVEPAAKRMETPHDLEDPWAIPLRRSPAPPSPSAPQAPPKSRRLSDDLGF